MVQVQVPNFPSNVRVPGVYVGIDPSQAGQGQVVQRALLIGTVAPLGQGGFPPVGAVPYDVPFIGASIATVQTQCGGAQFSLARMYAAYRELDTFGEVWCLPIQNEIALNNPLVTLTIMGTAATNGVLSVGVGGQLIQVPCPAGTPGPELLSNLQIACSLIPTLACDVTETSAPAVMFSNWDSSAVAIDIRLNPGGTASGQATPEGIFCTFTPNAGSTTEPSLTNGLANLGDQLYDFIALGPSIVRHSEEMAALMSDENGRWSWSQELFGGVFACFVGTFAEIDTFGASLNDQHTQVLGVADSQTPADEIAARYCATCASSLRSDPALPLTQIPLGFIAPQTQNRFTISERQTLLFDGISTFLTDQAGNTYLERSVTTNQTTASGVVSSAYLDTETLYTLMYVVRQIRIALQTKFARAKLVVDGTRIVAGSGLVTSQTVLGEVLSQYAQLATQGLVQDVPGFFQAAYAINAGSGQVSVFCPFNLAQQLRVIALSIQFKKF